MSYQKKAVRYAIHAASENYQPRIYLEQAGAVALEEAIKEKYQTGNSNFLPYETGILGELISTPYRTGWDIWMLRDEGGRLLFDQVLYK